MTLYKHIIHLGDSFTYGQDSGGDGIHDLKSTYPEFLSKLNHMPYTNLAMPGYSNLSMYYSLREYVLSHDIRNCIVIMNMSSYLRGLVTLNDDSMPYMYKINNYNEFQNRYHYSNKLVTNSSPLLHKTFGPRFFKDKDKHTSAYAEEYFKEHIIRICLDQYLILTGIKDLCISKGAKLIIVDMLFEKSELETETGISFDDLGVPIIEFYNPNDNLFNYNLIASYYWNKNNIHKSKSDHFYGEGYKIFADWVHQGLKKHVEL